MINKIIKEMNPKTIKGKLFDGNSLAFLFKISMKCKIVVEIQILIYYLIT